MKILLVTDYGTLAGGAEVIVFCLRDALRARGHNVRVFASSAGARQTQQLADDCCFGTTSAGRTLLQSANVSAMRLLRKVIDRFRPDVVHVNLYLTQLSPLILRVLRDVPTVYYAQWYRAICPLGTRRLPDGRVCIQSAGLACLRNGCLPVWDWLPLTGQRLLDRKLGVNITCVTAISRAVADRLAQHGAPHLRAATVLYPGLPIAEPRTPAEMTQSPTIVTAGRLVPEKGFDVLINAFARMRLIHPSARLVVLGDGPSREHLQRLTAELGLGEQVAFRGHLAHGDTLAEIRRCWCLCVPSLWEEPFGMIAAEAQMHGVAVVASDSGGLAEVVDDGVTGYLVQPGDVESFANRLSLLIADRDAACTLGRNGNERACQLFSAEAFADRFEAVYRDTIVAYRAWRFQGSVRRRSASST